MTPHAHKIDPAVSARADRMVDRLYAATGGAAMLAGAVTFWVLPLNLAPGMRELLVGGCIVLAAVFGIAGWLIRARGLRRGGRLAGWATLAASCLVSVGLGEGVHALALGFFPIAICLTAVTAGRRSARWMTVIAATVVLLLAGAERAQWLRGAAAVPGSPLELRVAMQLLMLGCSFMASALIAHVASTYVSAASERERRFRGLLRIAADWYWEMDDGFRFTHVAEQTKGASGLPSGKRIGRTPWEIKGIGIDDDAMDAHRSDLEAHRSFSGVLVQRRDQRGEVRYARVSGEPRFDETGVFLGYWGVGRDATSEMLAQQSIAASEARYRELFNRTPSPLLLHRFGRMLDANPAALELLGYESLEELIGQDLSQHCHDAQSLRELQTQILALERMHVGEALLPTEWQLVARHGKRRFVRVEGVRVEAAGGPASLSIYHDETEQRLADSALRRSEDLLSHVVASSPDCITLTEFKTGRFVMVNDAFVRSFGYAAQEVIGRTSLELKTWAYHDDRQRLVDTIRRQGRVDQFPATMRTKRGVDLLMVVSGATFTSEGHEYLVLILRDITHTERTRLEHHAILQSASIGIAFTRDHRFLLSNPYFDRMFGWPAGELVGQPDELIWPDEEAYAEAGRIAGPLLSAGQLLDVERQMRRRDGSTFWCRLLAQVVDPRDPSQGGTIWLAEDVTERRRVEQVLASARDAAEAASRAKSAFLANTSHEIRTPLNGLLGLARLAMQSGLDEARRQQYLGQIFDSAQSLSSIISDILDVSKIEAGKITLESVPFGLRETLLAVHHAYGSLAEARGLELILAIDDTVPVTVRGDPVRVRQILSNYVTNALKFTESGRVHMHAASVDAERIRLSVSDTGPGIDAATQQRLFVPFTQADDSTTRRYGGTGLGLSICRQLAQLMGGTVGVHSEPGRGSTFWAELPLPLAQALEVPADDARATAARLHGARVLMVEDNPVNMMIGAAMLEQWGIQVIQANDGRVAVKLVEAASRAGLPFDAVLMDVQMPHMSGHEAARAMRRYFDAKALPIIALTAAALISEREQAMASGMNAFLTKPIDAQRLRDTLAQHVATDSMG